MTTCTRFDLKFFRALSNKKEIPRKASLYFPPPPQKKKKLALLSLLKKVKPSPDPKSW